VPKHDPEYESGPEFPVAPQTNGKAERFIKTALAEWAYARSYPISEATHSSSHSCLA